MGQDIPGRAVGRLTKDLVGAQLQSILGTDNWVFNNNLYPILKHFANNNLCKIAISPAYFYHQGTNYESHFDIHNDFTLNLENGVYWSNAYDIVKINGNQGSKNKAGRDELYAAKYDTFQLTPDKYVITYARKIVPVRVVDSLLLTIYANIDEGGSIEGGGLYEDEESVGINAVPNHCYRFVNWTDSATGNVFSWSERHYFCIDRDLTLIANFIYDTFNLVLNIDPEDAGVVSGGGGFACGIDSIAIIEAIPHNYCYIFTGWTDEEGNLISTKQKDTLLLK